MEERLKDSVRPWTDEMRLRDKIEKELEKNDMTVSELCEVLNINNEFDILSSIGDLEWMNIICLKSFRICYQPDGCAVYVAVYGKI